MEKVWLVYFADIVVAVCASKERAEQAAREDTMDDSMQYYLIEEVPLLS